MMRLTLVLGPEEERALRVMAREQGVPMARVVRDAILNQADLCTILESGGRVLSREADSQKLVDVAIRRHVFVP